jgi:pimeloyl-ACP methyl ester carboxylesterase
MRFQKLTPIDGDSAIVLLPGWATDYRIFDRFPVARTRIIPLDPITHDCSGDLAAFLRDEGISPVDFYGWSLGGALALRFARQYPELTGRVIVAAVRPSYPLAELESVRRDLKDNATAFLGDFYRRCFLPGQRDDYRWFKDTLLADYQARFAIDDLIRGLDCLGEWAFDEADLSIRPTTILHGDLDVIAPVTEIADVAGRVVDVDFHVVSGAAHAVFLSADGRKFWPYD